MCGVNNKSIYFFWKNFVCKKNLIPEKWIFNSSIQRTSSIGYWHIKIRSIYIIVSSFFIAASPRHDVCCFGCAACSTLVNEERGSYPLPQRSSLRAEWSNPLKYRMRLIVEEIGPLLNCRGWPRYCSPWRSFWFCLDNQSCCSLCLTTGSGSQWRAFFGFSA